MSEELLPCPFCGCTPKTIDRPDNIDGTQFFFGVMCYCGGYSACAHKMAIRETADLAKADAIEAWNRRVAVATTQLLEQITNLKERVRILEQAVRYESDLCQQALDSRKEMENEVVRYADRVKRDRDYILELRGIVEELQDEIACVRQALPEQWRDSVSSVAVSTLVEELELERKAAELYRWLRDYHIGDDPESINLKKAKTKGLDAAIIAAIKEQK